MIALDANVLVHAHREECSLHLRAAALLRDLACGEEPWALPWPCVYEFLRVVTHRRIFDPPTDLEHALEDIESLIESPSLALIGEGPGHARQLVRALDGGAATGNLVFDAHIAALALEHGVREIWTLDRDFARFPGIRARDPFA